MKTFPSTCNTLRLAALAGLAAMALTGCMTSVDNETYASGGESAYIKSETDNMSQTWNAGVAAKAAADTDTVTLERILVPLHFDAACQCFVRSAQFTNTVNFERT